MRIKMIEDYTRFIYTVFLPINPSKTIMCQHIILSVYLNVFNIQEWFIYSPRAPCFKIRPKALYTLYLAWFNPLGQSKSVNTRQRNNIGQDKNTRGRVTAHQKMNKIVINNEFICSIKNKNSKLHLGCEIQSIPLCIFNITPVQLLFLLQTTRLLFKIMLNKCIRQYLAGVLLPLVGPVTHVST